MDKKFEELLKLASKVVVEAEQDAKVNPTSDEIQVVIVEPEKKPYKKTIPNTLDAMREIVDGHIEVVPIGKSETGATFILTLNEEGRLHNLPFNKIIMGNGMHEMLVGTFFISAFNKQGDNITLNNKQCEKLIKKFNTVEVML